MHTEFTKALKLLLEFIKDSLIFWERYFKNSAVTILKFGKDYTNRIPLSKRLNLITTQYRFLRRMKK